MKQGDAVACDNDSYTYLNVLIVYMTMCNKKKDM